jgi:hypothetical protein
MRGKSQRTCAPPFFGHSAPANSVSPPQGTLPSARSIKSIGWMALAMADISQYLVFALKRPKRINEYAMLPAEDLATAKP